MRKKKGNLGRANKKNKLYIDYSMDIFVNLLVASLTSIGLTLDLYSPSLNFDYRDLRVQPPLDLVNQ